MRLHHAAEVRLDLQGVTKSYDGEVEAYGRCTRPAYITPRGVRGSRGVMMSQRL